MDFQAIVYGGLKNGEAQSEGETTRPEVSEESRLRETATAEAEGSL